MKLHFQQVGCELVYKKTKKVKKDDDEDDDDKPSAPTSMSLYIAKLRAPYTPPKPKHVGPPKF